MKILCIIHLLTLMLQTKGDVRLNYVLGKDAKNVAETFSP